MKSVPTRYLTTAAASLTLVWVLGCGNGDSTPAGGGKAASPARPKEATPAAAAEGWGTIHGRVVFAGDKLPEPTPLKVEKDTDHCLSKGPVPNEQWVVNPTNRGVQWAVVFLKASKGKSVPIHASLKEPNPKEIALDQPACRFEPHVIALRQGQKLVAKNPAPMPHNVVMQGLKNTYNVNLTTGQTQVFDLVTESGPVKMTCGAHPWMSGYAWIFEHPYYAVTDANGHFEIKLAPAGSQTLVVWQESAGYVPDAKGRAVEVKADGVLDLGEIAVKPE